jgi:hypothetical protein
VCIQHQCRRHRCSKALPSKRGLEADAIVVLPMTTELLSWHQLSSFLGIGSDNATSGLPLLLRVFDLLPLNLTILSIVGVGQKLWPCLLEEGMVFHC